MRLFFVPFVIKEHEGKLTKKRSFYRVMLYNMNTQSAIHNLQFADCRLPIADCRLPTADCRLPTADCRLPIADCRLPTADCRLPIVDCRLPIADCRLPITDCRLPIADCRLLRYNRKFQAPSSPLWKVGGTITKSVCIVRTFLLFKIIV